MAQDYIPFTEKMIKTHKILIPTMLPIHFSFIGSVLSTYGYNVEILNNSGREVAETGLKYVHNDTCYPAILVIGQFISALKSGRYDSHRVALMLFQSGGGCRASNYVPLLRKALERAGFEHVPVISFSLAGLEKHPGFVLDTKKLHGMMYAVLYGDLMMSLVNQCKPYEVNPGEADELITKWQRKLGVELGVEGRINYRHIKENYRRIVRDFAAIEMKKRPAVKVGIVGEIYVKFSPLGNNNLEDFLISEGAEVTVPGLADFCLYTVYNNVMDYKLYGGSYKNYLLYSLAYKFLCKKKRDIIRIVKENSDFAPMTPFEETVDLAKDYISHGVKMGEGWLLTAEMLELAHSGVKNIICTQPFGCLPNHICGKGMMRPIKEANPGVNIVAIDYDAGATRVNQENRIKLMLANAQENTKPL